MGGQQPYEGFEAVASEAYGPGWLAPANEDQGKDLILFNKKKPPRDAKGRPVFAVIAYEDRPVCGSKKRGKAAYCGSEGRMVNGRCKDHGGRSPKGTLSPHYATGEHSKYAIPPTLVARYQDYIQDPEINHHRSSIAQIDTLLNELWENYEHAVDPEIMEKIAKEYRRCANANAAHNRVKAAEHFEELGKLIDEATRHATQGDRILYYLEARRRHADSETRRKATEDMVYSVEEAYIFYTTLGEVVQRHVKDEETLDAILRDIYEIGGDAGATSAGPEYPGEGGGTRPRVTPRFYSQGTRL